MSKKFYGVVVVDDAVSDSTISNTAMTLGWVEDEWAAAEAGAAWLSNYPTDIAMLVEEELE